MFRGEFHRPEISLESELAFNQEIAIPIRNATKAPQDFVKAGLVTAAEAEEDTMKLAAFKHSSEYEEHTTAGEALEFCICKMFEDGVFGDAVKSVQKTTPFDDMTRGIDLYVNLGESGKPILLGIDTTVSQNPAILTKKVMRNLSAVERNRLPAVKYFYEGMDNFMRREQPMPRVIIGVLPEAVLEIQAALLSGDEDKLEKYVPLLINQMIGQLETLQEAAPPQTMTRSYISGAIRGLEKILKEKDLRREELAQAFKDDGLSNPGLLEAEETN